MLRYLVLFLFLIPTAANGQHTILWKVSREGDAHTSYLLGTFHQMGNSFADSLPVIKNTMLTCDMAVFETLDNGDKLIAMLNARNGDSSYAQSLKPADVDRLHRLAAGWTVPVSKLSPPELLIKLRQLYTEKHCGTVKPTDAWKHLDNYLLHMAKQDNLQLAGLESDTAMVNAINMAGPRNWEAYKKPVHEWLDNIETGKSKKQICGNAADYLSFRFNYQLNESCDKTAILSERNSKWLQIIPGLLQQHNCFIAVGLLHLYGNCGLITQLRQMGYSVEEVEMK